MIQQILSAIGFAVLNAANLKPSQVFKQSNNFLPCENLETATHQKWAKHQQNPAEMQLRPKNKGRYCLEKPVKMQQVFPPLIWHIKFKILYCI